tara:strand:- start:265 stop:828 length:564 start_codon:yes stop_codon:yes gene_type:complete
MEKVLGCGLPHEEDARSLPVKMLDYCCPGLKNYLCANHEVLSVCCCGSNRKAIHELPCITRFCLLLATLGYRFSLAVVFASVNAVYTKTVTTCGTCPENCSTTTTTTSSLGGGFSFDLETNVMNMICTQFLTFGTHIFCKGLIGRNPCIVNLAVVAIGGAVTVATMIMQLAVGDSGRFELTAYLSCS